MTFREFMVLNEQPAVMFSEPTRLVVNIDGKTQKFTVDIIDVRAEDWTPTQVRTADGVVMQSAPRTISSFQPFSLPLANGTFINHDIMTGNEISQEPMRNVARKDWATFAQFLLGNKVVKPAKYRPNGVIQAG